MKKIAITVEVSEVDNLGEIVDNKTASSTRVLSVALDDNIGSMVLGWVSTIAVDTLKKLGGNQ